MLHNVTQYIVLVSVLPIQSKELGKPLLQTINPLDYLIIITYKNENKH